MASALGSECVWASTDGDPPQRTYPITIDVRSIGHCAATRRRRPSAARQREIAREVKRLLERQDPTREVRLAPAD